MRPLLLAGIWGAFVCTGAAVVDKVTEPADLHWVAVPASFPVKGEQMAVVEGDPFAPGPYVVKVKLASGKIVEMKGTGPLTRE